GRRTRFRDRRERQRRRSQGARQAESEPFRRFARARWQRADHSRNHGAHARRTMSATLIDTNVLLDLATNDPIWADWSVRALDSASIRGPLLINDVIYAELSVRFAAIEMLDAFVEEAGLEQSPTPRAALFLAGKAFRIYRSRGGARSGVLP